MIQGLIFMVVIAAIVATVGRLYHESRKVTRALNKEHAQEQAREYLQACRDNENNKQTEVRHNA